MPDKIVQAAQEFGGQWTIEKLNILERYLDAYTTALKNTPFELWYIDAFAGTGSIKLPAEQQGDVTAFIKGSAKRALGINDKPFNKLVFVEKDSSLRRDLYSLKQNNPDKDIQVLNSDANLYLSTLDHNWSGRRGVLFLDPFSTQVKWETIEKVASFQALDMWLLFPVSAISRMLPKSRLPDDIDDGWVSRLNAVFGDQSWRDLYKTSSQLDMFDPPKKERDPGVDELCEIYKNKLSKLFGNRYLDRSRILKNSNNAVLFEFLFCAGHPKGAKIAKDIAKHILDKL